MGLKNIMFNTLVRYTGPKPSLAFLFNQSSPVSAKDPTSTITLRKAFSDDGARRLRELKRQITHIVVDLDVFGLSDSNSVILAFDKELAPIVNIDPRAFAFESSAGKIAGFQKWLTDQHKKGLLELTQGPAIGIGGELEPWSNTYVRSSYQKGLETARRRLTSSGAKVATAGDIFGGVRSAFNRPFHTDRVKMLYTRAFTDLKGVTDWMDKSMSNTLAQGLVEGISPNQMAKRLNDIVETKPGAKLPLNHPKGMRGIERARLIARTEVTHAYNAAQLNEYEDASRTIGEPVLAEWWTALDERVRGAHAQRHGKIFDRVEAEQLIGEPNCRCTLIPFIESIHGEKRKTKRERAILPVPTIPVPQQKWEFISKEDALVERITSTQHIDFIQSSQKIDVVKRTAILNSIGESTNDMYTRFPGLEKKMKDRSVTVIRLTKGRTVTDTNIAQYSQEYGEIELPSGLLKKDNLSIGRGKHLMGTDLNSTYRHEFGHHVHRKVLTSQQRIKWTNMFNERKLNRKHLDVRGSKIKLKEIDEWFKKNLSKYGGSMTSEAFAESFSAYTSPLYTESKKKLPDFIEQFLKDEVV